MTVLERQQRPGFLGLFLDRWQALLVVGVWLYFHSYQGLIHDSRLYTVQALRVLHPEAYAKDLFFFYGSQDSFTAFPWLHAVFIRALGAAQSGVLLTLLGQTLWLTGAAALLRRTAVGPKLLWGLLALAALPPDYGGYRIFAYGEGFVTARLYAEALTFWALSFVTERWALSVLLALGAVALHPLYGAVALAAVVLMLARRDRRWALLVPLGGAAAFGLAAAGVAPFAALFDSMDPAWRAIVEKRNVVCFPLSWRPEDFAGIALDVIVVELTALSALKKSRDLLGTILIVALGGFALSLIGDASSNLLLIQLQPSRALWLLSAAANFSMGAIAFELLRREAGRAVLALLSVGFLMQLFPYFAVSLTIAGAWFAFRLLGDSSKKPPAPVQALAFFVLGGVTLAYFGSRIFSLGKNLLEAAAISKDWVIALLRQPSPLDGIVAAAALCLLPSRPTQLRRAMPVIASCILAVSVIGWNARPRFQRALETGRGLEQMRAAIPEGASVFWRGAGATADKEAELIWFGLGRTPYLSYTQGAGLIFNRATAVEFARRVHALDRLIPPEYAGLVRDSTRALSHAPPPSLTVLQAACNEGHGLDFVVLHAQSSGAALATWDPQNTPVLLDLLTEKPKEELRSARYYLYSCDDFRNR